MPQMIIASRLADGFVVFRDARGGWVASIDEGVLLEDSAAEEALAAAKANVDECVVVDPYLVQVEVADGRRRPASIRESIRAFGPTVKTYTVAEGTAED